MKQDDHLGQRIHEWNFTRKLGEGAWAKVYEVVSEKTRNNAACKVIPKKSMVETPKLKQLVKTEITVLRRCNNENVIKLIDSFETDKNVYIIMEFCNGGDMEEYLNKKKMLAEDEARQFLKQILNGFKGLHEVDAMHRDFKAANILLHNGVAKIADLGFAKIAKNMTATILGTSVTMAPELLENKKYDSSCDIWSVGVVYYQLLIGDYPYNAINDAQILKKIKRGPPNFPSSINISENSKNFILRCLTMDTQKRITWKQIYDHPLFVDKANGTRQTYLGNFTSTFDINQNKNFYEKKGNFGYGQNNANMYPPMNNMVQFKPANLQESHDIKKMLYEMNIKKEMEKANMEYLKIYVQRRNKIMLLMKYGIIPIFEQVHKLPFHQYIYIFLICKRAYLEMQKLNNDVVNRVNIFKLGNYFQQFLASKEYNNFKQKVHDDFSLIEAYASSALYDVTTSNPKLKAQLNLTGVTNYFQTIFKEELQSYSFLLFDQRDSGRANKSTVMRLIAFLVDLTEGNIEKVDSEAYDRRMENMDIRYVENYFNQKLQALYGN